MWKKDVGTDGYLLGHPYRDYSCEDRVHSTSQCKYPKSSLPCKFFSPRVEQVSWKINGSEIPLGTITLSPLDSKHKRATINQTTTFQITDEDAFGQFTKTMITQPNFTWHLHSDGLKANALKFPVAKGISFDKDVTLNGINSFNGNVRLLDFQVSRKWDVDCS